MIRFLGAVGKSLVRILTTVLPGIAGRNPQPVRPTPRPPEYRP